MVEVYLNQVSLNVDDASLKRIAVLVLQRHNVAHKNHVFLKLSVHFKYLFPQSNHCIFFISAVTLLGSEGKFKSTSRTESAKIAFK